MSSERARHHPVGIEIAGGRWPAAVLRFPGDAGARLSVEAAAALDHVHVSGVLAVDAHEPRLAGGGHGTVGSLAAAVEISRRHVPALEQIRGTAALVVAGAVAELHANAGQDMRAVRIAGLEAHAVVLEADVVERRGTGAVVVEEPKAFVVAG